MRQANTPLMTLMLTCALTTGHANPACADEAARGFFEPFDTLDRTVWFISDGWTNGPHQNCTWSGKAVRTVDGVLQLAFIPGEAGNGHLCGEIQTKATFHYGTYEARVRTATGSGLNAAFFTYIGPVHDAPHDEIDFEVLTRDTGRVSLNTFVDGEQRNGTTVPVDPPTDAAFHDFAFLWEPEGIRWFVDGVEVHRATSSLPVTPQKLYLSLWGSDTFVDWMGPFETPPGPVVMEVDWTAFTPLGGTCQFPESLLCTMP